MMYLEDMVESHRGFCFSSWQLDFSGLTVFNVGAFIIRIASGGIFYYNYNQPTLRF